MTCVHKHACALICAFMDDIKVFKTRWEQLQFDDAQIEAYLSSVLLA